MTTMSTPFSGRTGWIANAEAWLDARGKPAWFATMILGFVIFWPVGLAVLGYMIFAKRMFGRSGKGTAGIVGGAMRASFRSSGNVAFDSYKADTLRRLEDEQRAFEEFLQRLREARDKAEFDQFMADRDSPAAAAEVDTTRQ